MHAQASAGLWLSGGLLPNMVWMCLGVVYSMDTCSKGTNNTCGGNFRVLAGVSCGLCHEWTHPADGGLVLPRPKTHTIRSNGVGRVVSSEVDDRNRDWEVGSVEKAWETAFTSKEGSSCETFPMVETEVREGR